MIRCPHCETTGCNGRCRFRLGRRGFIGLALGAMAAAALPTPIEHDLSVEYGSYTQIFRYPFGFTRVDTPTDLYAGRVIVDLKDEILMYQPSASPLRAIAEGFRKSEEAALERHYLYGTGRRKKMRVMQWR